MDDLKKLYDFFWDSKFPLSSSNEELSDIYFDLVLFDEYCVGSIDRIIKYKEQSIKLEFDSKLENRINNFLKLTKNQNDIETASEYLERLNKLKEAIQIANR